MDYTVHGILQNTGVGSLSLLQGIFPTQGLNPGLPHCRQILYQLSHKRSPRIWEWGSLSLLQGIFPTQKLNQGLLYCRQILYQLSCQGSPNMQYMYTMEYYSAIKRNGIMPFDMDGPRDYLILSEISQTKTNTI